MNKTLKHALLNAALDPIVARPARDEGALAHAAEGPLVVAGLFQTASGIGQSARVCADALERQGRKPLRVDLSQAFNQVDVACDAPLTTLPNATHGTLILHLNAPETLRGLVKLGLFRLKKWRVIGYWVWEFEETPPDWREATRYLSEIWTPTHFSANAIRVHADLPVRVAPHYVAVPERQVVQSTPHDSAARETVVLTAADGRSSLSRKNLVGAINAFRLALGDRADCRLILKTRNLFAYRAAAEDVRHAIADHPRIELIDTSMSETEKRNLIASCDIFLSLHRSEGFGLVMAEAMALEKAVIATGWSGNLDFMNDATARLVPYTLTPVVDKATIYDLQTAQRWAEPDLEEAVKILRELTDSADKRRILGERARAYVAEHLDGAAYGRALDHTPQSLSR